jgi:hypothetical protein
MLSGDHSNCHNDQSNTSTSHIEPQESDTKGDNLHRVTEAPTDDLGSVVVEVVVTHGAPRAGVEHLDTTRVRARPAHQTIRAGRRGFRRPASSTSRPCVKFYSKWNSILLHQKTHTSRAYYIQHQVSNHIPNARTHARTYVRTSHTPQHAHHTWSTQVIWCWHIYYTGLDLTLQCS